MADPVMVAGGFGSDGGEPSGDSRAGAFGGRTINGQMLGGVTAPGGDVPTGDPIQRFPVGRRPVVKIDLSDSHSAQTVSEPVTVPDWASSFSVYIRSSKFGASTVVAITEGPPDGGISVAFATPITLTTPASGNDAASRNHGCMGGTVLTATTTTGTSGADTSAEVMYFFSPNAPT